MITSHLSSVFGTGSAQSGSSPDPVFLLAPARSYSTVSVALLAGHPSLYGLPETSLFACETLREAMEGANRLQVKNMWAHNPLTGLARAAAQLHEGSQDPAALSRGMEWVLESSAQSPRQVMDHFRWLINPLIALEKSPSTVTSAQALARCMRAYPNARYLHLARHPVSTQRSMLSLYNKFLFPPDMPHEERVRRCLRAWYSSHLRIVQALRALPDDQRMLVRAEDLIGRPRAWLPRILDWLGLHHDETVISCMLHTERWEFARWRPEAGFGAADPNYLKDPSLRPIPLPSHELTDPEWKISDGARTRISALARHLGY
jgi:hypothetical protein